MESRPTDGHLSDRRRVRLVHGERRPGPPCPVNEQVDGVVLRQRLDRQPAVTRGRWQRRHRHATSPATPSCSRLVASTDTFGLTASTLTTNSAHSAIRCSHLSRMTNDRPASPSSTAATSAAPPRRLRQAQRLERRRDRPVRAPPPLNEPHAARERGHQLGAHRQRQASLANTSRPGQRHHRSSPSTSTN